jgi:hypothetical protein
MRHRDRQHEHALRAIHIALGKTDDLATFEVNGGEDDQAHNSLPPVIPANAGIQRLPSILGVGFPPSRE